MSLLSVISPRLRYKEYIDSGGIAPKMADTIIREGKNCWKKTFSKRVAFLIDGDAYFSAFAEAVARAQRSILVLGWDFDSRTRLYRQENPGGYPSVFKDFIMAVLNEKPDLHAYVLGWDFAMVYALEREPLPLFRYGLLRHKRLHFRLDGQHPLAASHHQKVVVVDDAIAFVGGFDITKRRWDTPEHRANDPRRIDPDGIAYAPFHDVQMAVDGGTAQALGDLARERWRRATGQRLGAVKANEDPWPSSLGVDIFDCSVAIARTVPKYVHSYGIREVESLFLDSVEKAEKQIYIENQYFTSTKFAETLGDSLKNREGPEVVMVMPKIPSGLLEETTMGVMRARLLKGLRKGDTYHRLRVYCPWVSGLGDQCVNVHSKLMIVDDRFVRVGSANLSNRSMGLDTECDLAIEAESDRTSDAIKRLKDRLLAEHLGVVEEEVTQAVREKESLVAGIESLRGRNVRTLEELDGSIPTWMETLEPAVALLDPEKPIDSDRLFKQMMADEEEEPARHPYVKAALIVASILTILLLWRYGPLKEWAQLSELEGGIALFRESIAAPAVVIGGFVFGSLIMFPVTLMIVATIFTFGGVSGFLYAYGGAVAGALAGYCFGRILGRDTVRRFAGRRLNRLSKRLARRGVLAVVLARMVPVLPFTVVNIVAGASHIRIKDFVLGTAIGMLPGLLAIALFEKGLEEVIREPGEGTILLVIGIAVLALGSLTLLKRFAEGVDAGSAGAMQKRKVQER
jgi:phosphatidylserine/phosphatidylglycerophosphate/cardiolipin synthase-like enzyme/uncharacterized membrane protein YdjX (TVP38/TMEM64 family)